MSVTATGAMAHDRASAARHGRRGPFSSPRKRNCPPWHQAFRRDRRALRAMPGLRRNGQIFSQLQKTSLELPWLCPRRRRYRACTPSRRAFIRRSRQTTYWRGAAETGPRRPSWGGETPKAATQPPDNARKAAWLWGAREPITEGCPVGLYVRQARRFDGPIPPTLGYLPPNSKYPPAMIAAFGFCEEPEPG